MNNYSQTRLAHRPLSPVHCTSSIEHCALHIACCVLCRVHRPMSIVRRTTHLDHRFSASRRANKRVELLPRPAGSGQSTSRAAQGAKFVVWQTKKRHRNGHRSSYCRVIFICSLLSCRFSPVLQWLVLRFATQTLRPQPRV